MFGALLKPYLTRIWPVSVEETRASGQKETRIIQTLEPVIQQHRLVVDRKVIEQDLLDSEEFGPEYSLFYQMTRITKDKGCLGHDDRLDALEMAVSYWMVQMEVDNDKAAKDAMIEAICEDGPIAIKGTIDAFFEGRRAPGNFVD
jgi:hypothetical protein